MNKLGSPIFTAAVIILYFPDDETLDFIEKYHASGAKLSIVVNAINNEALDRLIKLEVWQLTVNDENLGLAKALNQGIDISFKNGASFVFLLDQDSRPDFDLHLKLSDEWLKLNNKYGNLGAISPVLIDIKGLESQNIYDKSQSLIIDTMATSGTLISIEAYNIVGPMMEWLFIDCIDHDWCFRAAAKGLVLVQVNKYIMAHDMGDDGITILGTYRPLHHSPIRHFYIIRNTIYLLRQSHIPKYWRIREALKTIYRIPIYFIISSNKMETGRNIFSALGFRQVKNEGT